MHGIFNIKTAETTIEQICWGCNRKIDIGETVVVDQNSVFCKKCGQSRIGEAIKALQAMKED